MLGTALVVASVIGPAPALAQVERQAPKSAEELVGEARILHDEQEWIAALARLEQAERASGVTRALRAELLAYRGVLHLRLGQRAEARAAFTELVKLDPVYRIDHRLGTPAMLAVLEEVRSEVVRGARPELEHTSPAGFARGAPIELEAVLVDATRQVGKVVVYYRPAGSTADFSSTVLTPDAMDPSRRSGVIPWTFGYRPAPFSLSYYLAAVGHDGDWLATLGSPAEPLGLEIEGGGTPGAEKKKTSGGLLTRWWFWTGVAAVAAGGGAGAYLLARPSGPPPDHGGAIVVVR